MTKTLVIVESPAKAKTIGRYLGKDYIVTASVGHIRDLPSSALGVNVRNNFKPLYITMRGKEQVVRDLKKKQSKVDRVLLATDPDREGEAIAWHLTHLLKVDPQTDCRIVFNEITASTIKSAVDKPRQIDMNLVDAQQARRIIDRLIGYELSPLLWEKISRDLSAGRVQSVAVRLLVLREREIASFKPEEYWLLTANLQADEKAAFDCRYYGNWENGKAIKHKLENESQVQQLMRELETTHYQVAKVVKKPRKKSAFPPFTTSTMQQQASRSFGFSAQRTMRIAQQLYEGVEIPDLGTTSLITYMRTDSVRIAPEAAAEARNYISSQYGSDYLPSKPQYYRNRQAAQDGHECIRPIHFDLAPEKLRAALPPEQLRLYTLIWDKFIASQMTAAIYDTQRADIVTDNDKLFRVSGEVIKFPGWKRQYGYEAETESEEEKTDTLPDLVEGESLKLNKLTPEQKFTQPPGRYTEASLIKTMEELGIGRPSTYAPTISTILNRHYVEKEGRTLFPTDLGGRVTVMLEEYFPNIVDTSFTAEIENKLDAVEAGDIPWVGILQEFYPSFHEQILAADAELKAAAKQEEKLNEVCPKCGEGELVYRQGRYGKFIACNRYPDCDYTRPIENQVEGECPLCGSGLLVKQTRKKRARNFYVCDQKGKDPNCPFISWTLPVKDRHCPQCGSYMVYKRYVKPEKIKSENLDKYIVCSNSECPCSQTKSKKKDDK